MQQWFHAERGQQAGPLTKDDLVALFHSGRIAADTLVWRDGLPSWQPLRAVADELGIDLATPPPATAGASAPPPLPPRAPASGATPVYRATPGTTAAATKPRRPLWVTLAIVAAVAAVLLIPILAILAAIALPAYQDYTVKAKVTNVQSTLYATKLAVVSFQSSEGRCPTNDDDGFQAPEDYAQGNIASIEVGEFDNGHCAIETILQDDSSSGRLDGVRLWLDYDSDLQQWECSSDAPDKYLPMDCRG